MSFHPNFGAAYPDGTFQYPAYPDGKFQNGAYPKGTFQNGAYPDGVIQNCAYTVDPSILLSSAEASVSGTDITVTATSSGDLDALGAVFGVEYVITLP